MPTLQVDQVLSGSSLGLSFGLSDLLAAEFGGRRVLYALSRIENKLVELTMAADGSLSPAGSVALAGGFAVGSNPVLSLFGTAAGGERLGVAGLAVTPGQAVALSGTGVLGVQTSIAAAGPLIAPVGLDLGSAQGLLTGKQGGGLDLLTDSGGGYTFAATLGDAADRYLADVADSVSLTVAGVTYVGSVSATEDGVNLVEVTASSIVQRDTLGVAEGLPINTPQEIEAIARLGETLLVVGSFDTSSLSVVKVEAGGALQIADHVLDSTGTYFQGVSALDTAVFGDFAFAAAGGSDGGLSLFSVLPGGRLVHVGSIADSTATTLYRVSDIEMTVSGDKLNVLAVSAWEAGITRLGYDLSTLGAVLFAPETGGNVSGTALDDQVMGSALDDTLAGGAGADTISDGAGSDFLSGGNGADLFVMHPDGLADEIADFHRTEDRLDLSAFDFLYDVNQLIVTPTTDGAILLYGTETVILHSSDGAPLGAGDLTTAKILNVDRPPLLPFAQNLVGGAGADTLNGAAGPDTIAGAGGDDVLTGQAGDDILTGGAGNDTLDGGWGVDQLFGEAGSDLLVGGEGDDLLNGGQGDDVIYGDEYDWLGF